MDYRDYVRLGLNHHLLYADRASDPAGHEQSLMTLLGDDRLEILDMWIPEASPIREREIRAVLDSGKTVYYNVGTREGKEAAHPATLNAEKRAYSLDFYRKELDRAVAVRAVKVITNSGPDVPEDRAAAMDALVGFYVEICRYVPGDMIIMVEPTDRETSKRKFIGPSREAADLVRRVHARGCRNFASMVDMGHLPLMGETIEQGMTDTAGFIGHIHLGNCILKDKKHPMFGDKHVAWGIAGGEYDLDDVAELLALGLKMGYFSKGSRGSVSIEMRPIPGKTPEDSLDIYYDTFCTAWDKAAAAADLEVT